jgi:hypothetical protein
VRVLIAGCSFAEQLTSIIQKQIPRSIVTNLASSGVGNRFISDSVVLSTATTKYDLAYVSWTGLSRYDVCISSEHRPLFSDWSNQKNLFNRYYICTGGVGGWDYHDHKFANMLFKNYHTFVDHEQLYYNSILEIIKIQSYLKGLGVPAYFTCMINQFKADPDNMAKHTCEYGTDRFPALKNLIEKIDFDNWLLENDLGIYENCARLGLLSEDQFHPSMQGYSYWIDKFAERLKNDKIL